MADKSTALSIVIRTVDKATARINAISDKLKSVNERMAAKIAAVAKPAQDFAAAIGRLRQESGLDKVVSGFGGVGSAIAGILGKVALVGGAIGAAAAGLMSLIGGFDDLGDAAERIGVGVDSLAELRFAAQKSGSSMEALDASLGRFTQSLGEATLNKGPLVEFLKAASPALLKQLKTAKDTESAFVLLAKAAAKLTDPAKRAAFAQKTLGDASLAPLLSKGAAGIQELRDRYSKLAGPQAGAVAAAGDFGDAADDMKAATDGIKAALVEGLAPALVQVVNELRAFFTENRARIAAWAKDLGAKLPGAIRKFSAAFLSGIDSVQAFVERIGGLKTVAVGLAAVIVGPLVSSIFTLGAAILTTPVGWLMAGIAAIAGGVYLLIDNWGSIASFFGEMWANIKAAFTGAIEFVWDMLMDFTPLGFISEHWSGITEFFGDLWDGVTGIFKSAWDFIKGIVDKVSWAVDAVVAGVDAVKSVTSSQGADAIADAVKNAQASKFSISGAGAGVRGDITSQASAAVMPAQAQKARVTVDFANAPRGTRVKADPQNTAALDMSVGYQLLGAM